jgi:hypothetical protein
MEGAAKHFRAATESDPRHRLAQLYLRLCFAPRPMLKLAFGARSATRFVRNGLAGVGVMENRWP